MKLALKVVLATVVGILIILLGSGYLRARREVALFDSDMRRDHRILGDALGLCVSTTWKRIGAEEAVELVAQTDANRPGLRIGWFYADGRSRFRTPPLSTGEIKALKGIQQDVRQELDASGVTHEYLVTLVPVAAGSGAVGAIEIAESLAARDGYIRTSLLNTLATTGLTIAISAAVVLALGVTLVGRPLSVLSEKARRVGAGDLSGPLQIGQKDEIGELASEMNSMCDRLAAANARTVSEAAARIQALEQLRHADRLVTVGRLGAGIAHELGTPLNVVAGRVKLLQRGNLDADTSASYLNIIAEEVERIAGVIRQLLDFARRREPKTTAVDLRWIVGAAAKLVEPLAHKHGVTVQADSPNSVLAVGDSVQLEQVASNLIVNAIHASPERSFVELEIGRETRGSPPREWAFFRVTDHGQGIQPETLPHIFEPFFTTKPVGQGTGLGLSVAHGIIEEHGGSIHVRSEPGRGSSFTVYIPLASP